VIPLQIDRSPSDATAKPVRAVVVATDRDHRRDSPAWQALLRRYDTEHTFRTLKQTLGWAHPKPRNPAAADRRAWLAPTAYTQLRLTRTPVADLHSPWEKPPARPDQLSPARIRRGFRHLHAKTGSPATAPKPTRPGPGRPPRRLPRQRDTWEIPPKKT